MQRLLLTGGSGKVATLLRERIVRPGRLLRLFDLRPPAQPADGTLVEYLAGSVDDLPALHAACTGADAVIHLGGLAKEGPPRDIIDVNVAGSYAVLEAAHRAGVSRVVLVSSHHAVGYHEYADAPPGGMPADLPARPDTLYGWGKAAAELLGRLYADRYGMDVICLRVGSWCPEPPDLRGLAHWLSPDDGARLVEAALSVPSPGYRIVWGISANTRRWCSLAAGEAIGYHPRDDAERYAPALIARYGEPDLSGDPVQYRLGGAWPDQPLGRPPVPRAAG
ncbi:MAG TPA: NAD(P)-dependent oxidoreductase [Rugosimonospora sp.]|nr:NAD(P)-dependent oxidoreductase [Rugosimonospora sp.]